MTTIKKSLYESIINDIAKVVKSKLNEDIIINTDDDESSSQLLVRKTREKEEEIQEAVNGLVKSMESIKDILYSIDDLEENDKNSFLPDIKLLYETSDNEEEYRFNSFPLDFSQKDVDELCEFIYKNYNNTIYGEFAWWFDFGNGQPGDPEEMHAKLCDFANKLNRKYQKMGITNKELYIQGWDEVNWMEFNGYRPMELIKEMKKWIDKPYRQFIITKLDSESLYY